MISIINAKSKIESLTLDRGVQSLNIEDSSGYVLAEDVLASHNSPSFHQSAMDGFAVTFNSTRTGAMLKIIGEASAGKISEEIVSDGLATPIYTGAKVPEGADTVIPIEKVDVKDGFIIVRDMVQLHGNIRPAGSQFVRGDLLVNKGTLINSAHIAIFAMSGHRQVPVFKKPSIALIVTGTELIQPADFLPDGYVYESNSYMLLAALRESGFTTIDCYRIKDDYEKIKQGISAAADTHDVVILTGGVSMGKYDFVQTALKDIGVTEHFYKVKQKPGKPIYFGQLNYTCLFGLPGNPAAVYTCFYEYVYPLLNKISGKKEIYLVKKEASLKNPFSKSANLGFYLKGFYSDGTVEILEGQESYKMSSYSQSNCIVYLPEGLEKIDKSSKVEIHLLPFMI